MADAGTGGGNRLLLPLVAVSVLCVAEAVVIAYLLGRGGQPDRPAPHAAVSPSSDDAAASGGREPATPATASTPVRPEGPAVVRGRPGQRVESAGIAVTVLNVTNEPRYKEVTAPPESQKFVGVEVLLENDTGAGHGYFSTSFKIRDEEDRVYASGGLGVGEPPLEWGTIVSGEKVRGHLAFVVPREAKGLRLMYAPNDPPPGYRPIYIDLGQ